MARAEHLTQVVVRHWDPVKSAASTCKTGHLCLFLCLQHPNKKQDKTGSMTKQYYLTNPCEGHVAGTLTQWKHLRIQEGAAWSHQGDSLRQ